MAHIRPIEDDSGDIVDLNIFCSDFCNREYCYQEGLKYQGWYGCQEIGYSQPCDYCGDTVEGLDEE